MAFLNKKTLSKIKIIILAISFILLVLLPLQYLNATGFCFREMRYLNNREILDRYLFGSNYKEMSHEEKTAKLLEKRYAVYPDCCRVHRVEYYYRSGVKNSYLKWKTAKYNFSLVSKTEEAMIDLNKKSIPYTSYKRHRYSINCCGKLFRGDDFRLSINAMDYQNDIISNKKYWKEQENGYANN